MASENSTRPSPVVLAVCGLTKQLEECPPNPETFSTNLEFAGDEPITEIWSRVEALGFKRPANLEPVVSRPNWRPQQWSTTSTKRILHPYVEVEVVGPAEQSNYASKRINIDDTLIRFANIADEDQAKPKFELKSGVLSEETDTAEKLVVNDDLEICFHHTVRMPDDNKLHHLPASLELFPLFNVEQYESRLSKFMTERGGIFFSMWQREAMWIGFTSMTQQVYAVQAFVGNVNVISGLSMNAPTDGRKQDYIIVPQQKWIDGICVAPGVVRQFVAMPCAGYTVEGQITGEEKFGKLQFEVIPAYCQNLKHWSRTPPVWTPELEQLYHGRLSESKTPREEGLQPSDKVRAYPSPPTCHVPLTVSDLLEELPAEGPQLKVVYPTPQLGSGYGRGDYQHGGQVQASCHVPLTVSDLLEELPAEGPQLKVVYPTPQLGSGYARGDYHHGGQLQGSASLVSHDHRNSMADSTIRVGQSPTKSKTKFRGVKTTDIEAMGLAAGGKLIQDIARDNNGPHVWNKQNARLINVHILDPPSFE